MALAEQTFGFFTPTVALMGVGCANEIGQQAKSLGARHALLCTDVGMVRLGLAAKVKQLLETAGVSVTVFDGSEPNPTDRNVHDGVTAYLAQGCDAIVTLGGGSSHDCGKGIGMVSGNGGTGYIRVDWYTPDGLPSWGDGRLFLLGTEGYIELRKYVDISGNPGGNHLFIVDRQGIRYMDCSKVHLPFGPQFITDVVERTSVAQDQDQALLAAELVLNAQKNATRPISA
jgi:hypothetical protein